VRELSESTMLMRSRRLLCKWLMTKLVQPGCNQKAAQLKKKDPHLQARTAIARSLCVEEQLTKIKSRGKKGKGGVARLFSKTVGWAVPTTASEVGTAHPTPCAFVVQFYLIQGRKLLQLGYFITHLQPKAPAFCRTCSAVSRLHWNNAPERSTS